MILARDKILKALSFYADSCEQTRADLATVFRIVRQIVHSLITWEDLRDALALAFVLGIIACLYIAMQPHTPHEVRPTASVTRFAEIGR